MNKYLQLIAAFAAGLAIGLITGWRLAMRHIQEHIDRIVRK